MRPRRCYAMRGTDLGYGPVEQSEGGSGEAFRSGADRGIVLRRCYATSGSPIRCVRTAQRMVLPDSATSSHALWYQTRTWRRAGGMRRNRRSGGRGGERRSLIWRLEGLEEGRVGRGGGSRGDVSTSNWYTPRNPRQETAISVQSVPVMRFLVFDFGYRKGSAKRGTETGRAGEQQQQQQQHEAVLRAVVTPLSLLVRYDMSGTDTAYDAMLRPARPVLDIACAAPSTWSSGSTRPQSRPRWLPTRCPVLTYTTVLRAARY
eukprot:3937025-Rhodomonas_salina.2